MILVIYTRLDKPIPELAVRHILHDLPAEKASVIPKTGNARTASILGLLMLEKGAHQLGITNFCFNQLIFPPHQKPYHQDQLEFNITHSASLAACAISTDSVLGIDSETRRQRNSLALSYVFSKDELNQLKSGCSDFFELWVKKEAVAKAVGCGITGMKHVQLDGNTARYRGQLWYLQHLTLDNNDVTYLACQDENPPVRILYHNIFDCLNYCTTDTSQIQHYG